jgi:hypothetical protein
MHVEWSKCNLNLIYATPFGCLGTELQPSLGVAGPDEQGCCLGSASYEAMQKALACAKNATPVEHALINALPSPYPQREPIADQSGWDKDFTRERRDSLVPQASRGGLILGPGAPARGIRFLPATIVLGLGAGLHAVPLAPAVAWSLPPLLLGIAALLFLPATTRLMPTAGSR